MLPQILGTTQASDSAIELYLEWQKLKSTCGDLHVQYNKGFSILAPSRMIPSLSHSRSAINFFGLKHEESTCMTWYNDPTFA